MTQVLDARRDPAGGYKGDVTRAGRIGCVSSEEFSRPADEGYLQRSDLYAMQMGFKVLTLVPNSLG